MLKGSLSVIVLRLLPKGTKTRLLNDLLKLIRNKLNKDLYSHLHPDDIEAISKVIERLVNLVNRRGFPTYLDSIFDQYF
jgi:hypothetical protein